MRGVFNEYLTSYKHRFRKQLPQRIFYPLHKNPTDFNWIELKLSKQQLLTLNPKATEINKVILNHKSITRITCILIKIKYIYKTRLCLWLNSSRAGTVYPPDGNQEQWSTDYHASHRSRISQTYD